MNEKDMMHGRDYRGEELAGWLLSEKLHGCRGFWDGAELWTRGGNRVAIPGDWRAQLPALALDCEVYAGAGQWGAASVAVRLGRFAPAVRLHVFDTTGAAPWRDRLDVAASALAGVPFAQPIAVTTCRDNAHAFAELERVLAVGGEGLIARHPGPHAYAAGRFAHILKLKTPARFYAVQ